MKTMSTVVPYIRFHRPNGRKTHEEIELAADLRQKLTALHDSGCRITMELLLTGMVSLCIEHPYEDYAEELCAPEYIPEALEAMIDAFDRDAFNLWLDQKTEEIERDDRDAKDHED